MTGIADIGRELGENMVAFDPAVWLAEVEARGFNLWIFECAVYSRAGDLMHRHSQLAIDEPEKIPDGADYSDPLWRRLDPPNRDLLKAHLRSIGRVHVVPGDELRPD